METSVDYRKNHIYNMWNITVFRRVSGSRKFAIKSVSNCDNDLFHDG